MWPSDAVLLLNNLFKVVEGLLGEDSLSYPVICPCSCWVCCCVLKIGP